MCLAKAYLKENGERSLLLEEVSLIEIEDRRIILSSLFGEKKEMEAEIKKIDFQNSSVILQKAD